MEKLALAADIGGSHITSQLVNLDTNEPLGNSKTRIELNVTSSKDEILEKWVEAIKQSAHGYSLPSLLGIGFAMPGPFDYKNGIALFDDKVKKFQKLYGVNIRDELMDMLDLPESFPVRFINDAAAFAVGEASYGKPSEFNRLLAITLGTGFGTTFIKNKFPVVGEYGIPDDGFLYHVPFQNSIADDYFSTRWFLQEYKTITGKNISGVKPLSEMSASDKAVAKLFALFGKNLGTFLSPWIKQFDAECLVIGGNIANSFSLFGNELKSVFAGKGIHPEICISELGESAQLIGSAQLCSNIFYSKLYT